MNIKKTIIGNIPLLIWGEKKKKVYIAIHGNMSNKEDNVIKIFANIITKKDYQLISFDLPEHGERKDDTEYLCKAQNCVNDLNKVMNYAKRNYEEICIWACSMGAYFALLSYADEDIKKSIFLSPVVDMKVIIDNMMRWSNISEKELEEKKEIVTDFGQTLYFDYYSYVINHPIIKWNKNTSILYGSEDNMQEESLINNFSNKFNCDLTIYKGGEHFFHTKEQLSFYKEWLENIA